MQPWGPPFASLFRPTGETAFKTVTIQDSKCLLREIKSSCPVKPYFECLSSWATPLLGMKGELSKVYVLPVLTDEELLSHPILLHSGCHHECYTDFK